jgi:hypothetical protein
MRGAPPVQLDCARDARWRCFESALAAAAFGTLIAWAVAHGGGTGMTASGPVALALLAAAGAGAAWWRVADAWPRAGLHWDGAGWTLDGAEGRLALKLDAGRWVVLRFEVEGKGRARWLVLDLTRSAAPVYLTRAALRAHALVRENDGPDG